MANAKSQTVLGLTWIEATITKKKKKSKSQTTPKITVYF